MEKAIAVMVTKRGFLKYIQAKSVVVRVSYIINYLTELGQLENFVM